MWLFYYFDFERNYDVLNSKGPCILLNKNINLNKIETESKIENPTRSFLERRTLCFSSYKNRKLKVKLWWVGARERKKVICCTVYFVWRKCFNICILFQCIATHFQNIHTFTYQKTLLHTLLSDFKITKNLQCILKEYISPGVFINLKCML